MFKKIQNRVDRSLTKLRFRLFAGVLKKYQVGFYYRDRLGILTRREHTDNFQYIFETGNSCDAIPMMLALDDKARGANVSVDIGANIGITTVWLARHSRHVYAFEPEQDNLRRLGEHLSINHVENVTVVPKGAFKENASIDLNIYESYGHHSLSPRHASSRVIGTQRIEVVTLDDFCRAHRLETIDFLKIDIEGFEFEALSGARDMLKQKRIRLIVFEHAEEILLTQGKEPGATLRLLNEHNYRIFDLTGREIHPGQAGGLPQQDLYAM